MLYDEKCSRKVYRCFDRCPREVKEHIQQFWIDNSRVDSTPWNGIITDHSKRDENGNKVKLQILYIKWTYLEFYNMWKERGGVAICDRLECVCPGKATFVRERPKEIRFESITDRSVCKRHFNYEQMALTFNMVTENNHLCGSRFCVNYANNNADGRCICDVCVQCPLIKGVFKGDPDALIHKIYCQNGKEFPNIICVKGDCHNPKCGTNIIKRLLNRTLCRSFFIRPEQKLQYDHLECMKDTEKRKHHQIKTIKTKWCVL